ncbi:MAG: PilN domain-containing protein [Solirubrobacterales bacterium]
MRPVNLIPPDLRRGDSAPLRTGPLAYIVLGALVLMLAGVSMLVLANNKISDRKAEVVQLHREDAAAKAKAERLASYTQFQAMSEQRLATVQSLADSRFDWERVLRELALVLPKNVWLDNLGASASAGESSGESGGGGLTSSVQGPSLVLSGCTTSQDAVAGFVTALKDIDGVTRVGLESSTTAADSGAAAGGGCASSGSSTQFSLVVAFDAAPTPIAAEASAEPTATAPEAEGESESSEGG